MTVSSLAPVVFHAQKRPPRHYCMLRKFAIREDREELGNNTGPPLNLS